MVIEQVIDKPPILTISRLFFFLDEGLSINLNFLPNLLFNGTKKIVNKKGIRK